MDKNKMLQKQDFSTGGFVMHKIKIIGSESRFSAWYDKDGNLVAAERIDRRNRCYQPGKDQMVQLAKGGNGSHYVTALKEAKA